MAAENVTMADSTASLVAVARRFGGDALRGCWTFDPERHETRYVRADVEERLAGDVAAYVDNERYAFVTRDTYDALHPSSFRYTVRGFDGVEVFRTVLPGECHVGALCSFDAGAGRDYAELDAAVRELGAKRLAPR